MAWEESDRVSKRREFVSLGLQSGANISELCRRFNVSRKTGYKWLGRWKQAGDSGLVDQSRRPERSPLRTSASIEEQVVEIRRAHRWWGGRKIRKCLLDRGVASPSASTITAILHRHGLISSEDSQKHKAFARFERQEPNELWQMDFKGEFKVASGKWCYPLTILDDYSRYSLCIDACENQRRTTVQERLRRVFEWYGIPRAIYVDNGSPWGTAHRGFSHTRMSVWMMRQDIRVIHGRPCHPQGRGKLERFHRTFGLEVLQERVFTDGSDAQKAFDRWRPCYNHDRPHEALDLEAPASRYQVSNRSFREHCGPFEYGSQFMTRKVNKHGEIQFQGKAYRISEAFKGEPLGICPTLEDGVWKVNYCRFTVAVINQREGTVQRCDPRHGSRW